MDITRTVRDGVLDVAVEGRLDGYWSDHLERVLSEAIGDGHHRIRLDCAKLTFLSSAGIGVLVKFRQQLARINGLFQVVNPSKPVSSALTITNLTELLVAPVGATAAAAAAQAPARRLEQHGAALDIYNLDLSASLTCRVIGTAAPLRTAAFSAEHSFTLAAITPLFAIGVGAFGDSAADCRSRFGEIISVTNATAYQPADGTNVPDYLIAQGAMASDVRMLYGLACTGRFSQLIRFDAQQPGGTIGLADLLSGCLDLSPAPFLGVVIVAETSGLVGAALRHSPVTRVDQGDFFTHPAIRSRLSFTSEPAFARGVALAAGVIGQKEMADRSSQDNQLRPIGPSCIGHVHAAAFQFRPVKRGPIDLQETVSGLFETDALLGVLHLLHDDRGIAGAGDSEFVRGACWIAPLYWA